MFKGTLEAFLESFSMTCGEVPLSSNLSARRDCIPFEILHDDMGEAPSLPTARARETAFPLDPSVFF